MRLSKKSQYGVLMTLYMSRSGRVSLNSVAEGLGLSRSFLYQVAKVLRDANVIIGFKGCYGGYELNGNPTMFAIISALQPFNFLTPKQQAKYATGCQEERAFAMLVTKMEMTLRPVAKKPVRQVMSDLVEKEVFYMLQNKDFDGGLIQ